MFPSRSFTAIPTRSLSGSVPITISAWVLFAKSIAIFNASGSSGFGDFTVGKSPLGASCSFTVSTFRYPARFSTSGINFVAVPCKLVNTIFRFSRPLISKVPLRREAFQKASSISEPIDVIKFSLALKLISEKAKAFTSSIMPLSCGGTICPPSVQYTLYPLYSGGL